MNKKYVIWGDSMSRKPNSGDDSFSDRFLSHMMNTTPSFVRGECRITFEVGKGLMIEGIRSVCEYTEDRLIIATCSRTVIIEGNCLCICRMMEDAIVICGNIFDVKFA